MTKAVELFEVGPRDGLQNEPAQISTAQKVQFINALSTAGFKRIEVASFVSPKWVPQMANSDQVLEQISRNPEVSYAALTPNMTGFERAMAVRADEIAVFGSASEGFSRANVNASIAESLDRFASVLAAAKRRDLRVRGYVSCVCICPYEGVIAPQAVADVARMLWQMGCYEISLGDTIGQAHPEAVDAMLQEVTKSVPAAHLAGHFHDTSGRAFDNIDVAMSHGLRVFDTSVGGLGGCPFAPGSAGNVATERVHAHLLAQGFETGLSTSALKTAATLATYMRGQHV